GRHARRARPGYPVRNRGPGRPRCAGARARRGGGPLPVSEPATTKGAPSPAPEPRAGARTGRARLARGLLGALVTAAIFAVIFSRIPLADLLDALARADAGLFLATMIPNTLFYFAWDTLVLAVVVRWFHGEVRWSELL